MVRYQHKIIMGVCMPRNLKEAIDKKRGDIPRSKYISRILERQLVSEKERESATCLGRYRDKNLLTLHYCHLQLDVMETLRMTDSNYTPDISKDISLATTCYSIGCDNPATTTLKIPLNQFVCCLIHVCDNCLKKYPITDDINGCDRPHHPQYNEEQKQ